MRVEAKKKARKKPPKEGAKRGENFQTLWEVGSKVTTHFFMRDARGVGWDGF